MARKRPADRARYIIQDSRKSDKRTGRENTLTLIAVQALIAEGCSYCGDQKAMITLDRIDNAIGHVSENVVPACVRCNYIRRDMPHEAWLHFVSVVRKVRKLGLFQSWAAGPFNKFASA